MTCTCKKCEACNGTGFVWVHDDEIVLRAAPLDDTDDLEVCEECGGTGIEAMCDECLAAEAEAEEAK